MIMDEPYFLKNPKWFYYDEKDFKYKLTKEAPQKAKESYEEFYRQINGEKGD